MDTAAPIRRSPEEVAPKADKRKPPLIHHSVANSATNCVAMTRCTVKAVASIMISNAAFFMM